MAEASLTSHHPWPTVTPTGCNFPEGRYDIEIRHDAASDGGARLIVTHHLKGAGLIERLVQHGQAAYGTVVEERLAAYRDLQLHDAPQQVVPYRGHEMHGKPKVRGVIVAMCAFSDTIGGEEDGVDSIWLGRDIHVPKGGLLATSEVMDTANEGVGGMLRIVRDDEWGKRAGEMVVSIDIEDGFQWVVRVNPRLGAIIDLGNQNDPRFKPTMIGVVTACFAKLREEHRNDETLADEALAGLADALSNQELPLWYEANFDAGRAATALYPYGDCPRDPANPGGDDA